MSQYIGKTISLISSKGIRYVGILQDVNGDEATVTLQNVKPFGTEGRLGDPSKEVPPSTEIYPVVVFRGSDVHDLSVLDDPPAQAPAPAPAQQEVKESQPQEQVSQQQQPQQYQQQNRADESGEWKRNQQPQQQERQQYSRQNREQQQQQERNRQLNSRANVQKTFESKVPTNDFDFESSNELKREKITEDEDVKVEEIAPAYDKKKSFFDTISSSANEPSRPPREFNSYGNRGRGNGRGNGRGRGRGRGRGGRGNGRGGFYNDNEPTPEWA